MLYENNSISGLVESVVQVLPPIFKTDRTSNNYTLLDSISTGAKLIVDMVNKAYEQIMIKTSTSGYLDENIRMYSGIRRKELESDIDYYNRYIRYVFYYNCTEERLTEAIYDIYGQYPRRVYEIDSRSAYWGMGNLPISGQISGTASYYNNIDQFTKFWGNGNILDKGYTSYIFLRERPNDVILNELCKVLSMNKLVGTNIYLIFNEEDNGVGIPIIINNNQTQINSFSISWS